MRAYLAKRRKERPDYELWSRAKKRAATKGLKFSIDPTDILIPEKCPALGIPMQLSGKRSRNSPSLDRVVPERGYTADNVRVISDHANRLKSDLSFAELKIRASNKKSEFGEEYRLIAEYVGREIALTNVKLSLSRCRELTKELEEIEELLSGVCSERLDFVEQLIN